MWSCLISSFVAWITNKIQINEQDVKEEKEEEPSKQQVKNKEVY